MISFTQITYSVWVPNDGLPGFDDRLFVFDLLPFRIWDLTLACSLSSFFLELAHKAFNENGYLKPILIDL